MCHSEYEKKKIPTQIERQGRNSEQPSCKHAAQAGSQVRHRRVPGSQPPPEPTEQVHESKHQNTRTAAVRVIPSRCKSITEPLNVKLTYKNTILSLTFGYPNFDIQKVGFKSTPVRTTESTAPTVCDILMPSKLTHLVPKNLCCNTLVLQTCAPHMTVPPEASKGLPDDAGTKERLLSLNSRGSGPFPQQIKHMTAEYWASAPMLFSPKQSLVSFSRQSH